MTRTESPLDSFGEGFAGYAQSNIPEDVPRAKMLTEVVVQPPRKTRTIGTAVGNKYSGHQRPLVDRQIFHNGALSDIAVRSLPKVLLCFHDSLL
jgi:hypothetical protein